MKQATHHLPGIFDIAPTISNNQLLYGDNLTIMRNMPNACVDLIYLDPPWNSKRNYNLIYERLTGQPVPEQEEAFCDAWEMDAEKEEMARKMPIVLRDYGVDEDLVLFWRAWIDALRHTQPRLLAYLIYMSYRLFEMRRVLKPAGSLYLHCDPTVSHYIKVILDGVFDHHNFRNEIIWKRRYGAFSTVHESNKFGACTDTILFYVKSKDAPFYPQYSFSDPKYQDYIKRTFKYVDENGRRYRIADLANPAPRPNLMYEYKGYKPPKNGWAISLEKMKQWDKEGRLHFPKDPNGRIQRKRFYDELKGKPVQSLWDDIQMISSQSSERLGYPTQKPIALLQRIIKASSKEGDVIFDPFCGCGTAVYAAHLLNRKWIGCDIAILSVRLVRDVLLKRYGLVESKDYEISGIPLSVEGAEDLFERDPRQFQHWAVELAGGFSSVKTTGDRGIDGRIHFETGKDKLKNMVLSVKGGKLLPAFMRELHGTVQREEDGTEMGGLICLQQPTKGMREEAASAGVYTYLGKGYNKLQIRTIQELLDGKGFDTPSKVPTLGWKNQIVMPI
jgi:site-specific DNA-methyltransferase (adenine-specific)